MMAQERSGPPGPGAADGPVPLVARWIAAQMRGAVVSGDAAREFGNVSIDTRTLTAGDLYVAIRGERFDGAEFASAAFEAGAWAAFAAPRSASALTCS